MSTDSHVKEMPLKSNIDDEKPCRACIDFRSWMKLNRKDIKTETVSKDTKKGGEVSNAIPNFNIPIEAEYGGRGSQRKATQGTTAELSPSAPEDDDDYPKWGLAAKYGCPADSLSLGRGSWRLLHSVAAYYPESPSDDIKEDMNKFIVLLSKFYPCKPCAEDFREWIKENPPDVYSKHSLSKWFCNAHNEVNRKLGKPKFDCSLIEQRWHNGWKDGSCD